MKKLRARAGILLIVLAGSIARGADPVADTRKGRYLPEDHPFISKSLRRLVPGKQADMTISKLEEGPLDVIPLFKAPVPGRQKEEVK